MGSAGTSPRRARRRRSSTRCRAEERRHEVRGEVGKVVFDRAELGEQRDSLLLGEVLVEAARPVGVGGLDDPAALACCGLAHLAARGERGLHALDLVVEPGEVGEDAVAGVVEDLPEPPFVHAAKRVDALELKRLRALLEDLRAAPAEGPGVELEPLQAVCSGIEKRFNSVECHQSSLLEVKSSRMPSIAPAAPCSALPAPWSSTASGVKVQVPPPKLAARLQSAEIESRFFSMFACAGRGGPAPAGSGWVFRLARDDSRNARADASAGHGRAPRL